MQLHVGVHGGQREGEVTVFGYGHAPARRHRHAGAKEGSQPCFTRGYMTQIGQ